MHYLILLGALLLATPAWAGAWSKNCTFTDGNLTGTVGTPTNTSKRIGSNEWGCYRFNNADGETAEFSSLSDNMNGALEITSVSALITFDPQTDADVTAATTALVDVLYCSAGDILTAATPNTSCTNIGQLSGVGGPSGSQTASIRVGPGKYVFEITGECLAGDTCQIAVRGEGPGQ